ncbi:DDE-type integrase/transposase/recombinase [Celeribacter sp.]|uniref:DDE-type integrase/transposase/recombinase n=1 Tax=Celeribacter sp. TaxID=1890673 RepID=UPI003A8EE7B5
MVFIAVVAKTRPLSENGSIDIAGDLADCIEEKGMEHVRARHITHRYRARSSAGIKPCKMIEPANANLSISKQCKLLSISRSSLYYEPKGESEMNLDLMRVIDKQFLETPFYGVRQLTWHLRNEDRLVNEKRIRRLIRLMGLMPIYQKPNTSKAAKGHKIYPYLLRGLRVDRPNQVWCSDITYLPMRRGFLYLVSIMDWHTRKVLAWRISNTLEAGFCVDALNEAIHKFGPPEIMNTDSHMMVTSSRHSPGRTGCADPACVSQWMARGGSSTTSS